MRRQTTIRNTRRGNGIFLLIASVFACTVLIIFNYNTIKLGSSITAYISGESQYSKSQKDGVRHLLAYIVSEEVSDYELFLDHISVPISTGRAFDAMINSRSDTLVRRAFLQGKNNPDDVENIIWLYKSFKHYPFLQEAIFLWSQADTLAHELIFIGQEINQSIPFANIEADSLRKLNFIQDINILSSELSEKEKEFSLLMGNVERKCSRILFWVNTIVITIMLAIVVVFSNILISKLERSRLELEHTNAGLIATNDKLDNFIFAASHNLKAPINNLEGLLKILGMVPVTDPLEKSIRDKMNASVTDLTSNINRIEEIMNLNSKPDVDPIWINIRKVTFQILEEHNEYIENANISVTTHFKVEKLLYSESGINQILISLLSNSIKYISSEKPGEIEISTYYKEGFVVLCFADNGLGMDVSLHGNQVFGLFKRYHKSLSGNGVGLYLVKQIVERNGGKIKVHSETNVGTTFEIFLQKK